MPTARCSSSPSPCCPGETLVVLSQTASEMCSVHPSTCSTTTEPLLRTSPAKGSLCDTGLGSISNTNSAAVLTRALGAKADGPKGKGKGVKRKSPAPAEGDEEAAADADGDGAVPSATPELSPAQRAKEVGFAAVAGAAVVLCPCHDDCQDVAGCSNPAATRDGHGTAT